MTTLQAIAEQWARRSPREQLLSVAVAFMTLGLLVLLGVQGARATLSRLDRDIERMSTDLVNYHYQIARRQSVDARFALVSTQHSSAWSESEIRDRLRQEIYRLANRIPPGLDKNGIPVSTNSEGGVLVSIPKLGQGRLKEGGEGYREYQITVHIPATPVNNMLAYLERLQGSPQSLRIDRIDMRRDPTRGEVSADLDITRIVVDTSSGEEATALITALPEEGGMELNPADWHLEGCDATRDADGTLLILSKSASARAWMERNLPAGATYDIQIETTATGPARITVTVDGVDMPGQGEATLNATTGMQAIHLRFSVPQDKGGRAKVQFPSIKIANAGTTVRVRHLVVRPVDRP